MSQDQSQTVANKVQDTAVAAIAAASATPFRTAFKITLGIGAARIILALAGIAALATVICTGVYIYSLFVK